MHPGNDKLKCLYHPVWELRCLRWSNLASPKENNCGSLLPRMLAWDRSLPSPQTLNKAPWIPCMSERLSRTVRPLFPPCLLNAHPKYCSISVTEHSLEILLLPRIQINESVKLSRVYQRGLETSYGPLHTFRGILEIPTFILITALHKGKRDLLI